MNKLCGKVKKEIPKGKKATISKKRSKSNKEKGRSSDDLTQSKSVTVLPSATNGRTAREIHQARSSRSTDDEQDLFNDARNLWLTGDWDRLSSWHILEYAENAKKIRIGLLVASALHEVSDYDGERELIRTLLDWGARRCDLLNILIGQTHASMGRSRLAAGEYEQAEEHFLECIKRIAPNIAAKRYAKDRVFKEAVNMGFIPDALGIIQKEVQNLNGNSNNNAHIAVIETKVELLKHELSIAIQRDQIGTSKNSDTLVGRTAKDTALFKEDLKRRATSQLGQELWVLEKMNYKRGGFFVEFGATDGVLLSNTYLLEKEFGWNGLCAEPNPEYYEKLVRNRSCIVSQDCISGNSGEEVQFLLAEEYGGIVSHLDDINNERRKGFNNLGKYISLNTVSLNDYLKKHNAPQRIDYLSLDTEGNEYDILSCFPFERWKVQLISVEHNYTPMRAMIRKLLEVNGYECTEAQWDDWYELKKTDHL